MRATRPRGRPRYLNPLWPIEERPTLCTGLDSSLVALTIILADLSLTCAQLPPAGRAKVELLLAGTVTKVVLLPMVIISEKDTKTISMTALAVTLAANTALVAVLVVVAVRVSYHRPSPEPRPY